MKDSYIYQEPVYAQLRSVKFSVLGNTQMIDQNKVFVRTSNVQSGVLGSLLDPHLGSMSNQTRCLTCNHTRKKCQGHSGLIKLKHPYILPQFEQYVQQVLKRMCLKCNVITGENKRCPVCKDQAMSIKNTKGYKYDVNFGGRQVQLNPQQIQNLLSTVSLQEAQQILGIGVLPSEFIVNHVYVAPPIIRPDKRVQSNMRSSDDFTISLQGIAKQGFKLNEMSESDPNFDKLYDSFVMMIQNYHRGEKGEEGDSKMKALATSLCGKEGRIRFNMLGKRVNNIGRAVTACDTSNAPDEVTLPLEFLKSIHMKEVVRPYNKKRLIDAFNNGPDVYPGADIVQKPNGEKFFIKDGNITLEEGDTLYRHLVDGDRVIINRQPSLLELSLGSHRIRAATNSSLDTIDINVIAASQYHADFDGDELNSLFLTNWQSVAEATYISALHTRIIQYIGGKMMFSQVQDSVIGGYLMTRDSVQVDDVFMARIHRNSNLRIDMFKFFSDRKHQQGKFVSGKQALSTVFPELSYIGQTEFSQQKMPAVGKFVQYEQKDRELIIELGEIKSGYFDKGGSDFQTQIALLQDPQLATSTVFSIQQSILNFNKYCGFTVGFRDLLLSSTSREIIQKRNDQMLNDGYQLISQYSKNLLNEPIGKTRWTYLQDRIKQCFYSDGCDVLMQSAGSDSENRPSPVQGTNVANGLVLMALTGSKGSLGNAKNMLVSLGQVLLEDDALPMLFSGRLNMFYKKNDKDPRSHGIVLNSYLNGLTPQEMLTNCIPERVQMLKKVLSVAKPGTLGRKMIKNLEPLMVTNTRTVAKERALTQMLFGCDGFKVQCLGRYNIPFFSKSKQEFIQGMCIKVPSAFTESRKICEKHFADVAENVHFYKQCSIELQKVNSDHSFRSVLQIPLVVDSLLMTRMHQASPNREEVKETDSTMSKRLTENIAILKEFLAKLPLLYFNDSFVMEDSHRMPEAYDSAMNALKLALLCGFNYERLAAFTAEQLAFVLQGVKLDIMYGMMEPGSPIGVLVAQAYQEYFTQDMLDSIHKTASGEQQRDPLDRIIDIFNNKTPDQLHQSGKMLSFITIPMLFKSDSVVPLKDQRERAQLIASNIKLIQIQSILSKWHMLLGHIEKKTDPIYLEDQHFMSKVSLPEDCSQWCMRIVFDKMKLYLNKISINEIQTALERAFQVHVVSNREDSAIPIMRIYLSNSITFQSRSELQSIVEQFLQFSVRGFENILSATVRECKQSVMKSDGSVSQETRFQIIAEGYNLRDIYRLQHIYSEDIDFACITIDNPASVMQFYGLSAANQKLVNEIKQLFQGKLNERHVVFLASEMTQMGILTNIEQNGIRQRNRNNDLLMLSDSRPISAIKKASISNRNSCIEGISANLMVGQIPRFGTTYNQFVLNENFLSSLNKEKASIFDAI